MAYSQLISDIEDVIKTNGNQEITGQVLQNVLVSMVNSLGAHYQYAGVADTSTTITTTEANVFYLLTEAGTYANMSSSIVHTSGIGIALWNGTDWSYQNVPSSAVVATDATPTENSTKPVQSGGVWNEIKVRDKEVLTPTSISGLYVAASIATNSNTTLYYVPVLNGETISITATFSSDYMRTGFTTSVPARFVPATDVQNYSSSASGNVYEKTAPADGYFAVSFKTAALDSFSIYHDISGTIGSDVYNLQQKALEIDGKVGIKYSKNLFDVSTITSGKYIASSTTTGVLSNNDDYSVSDYIRVSPSTDYYISSNGDNSVCASSAGGFAYYKDDKTFVSAESATSKSITTPSTAGYMRISIYNSRLNKVQVEKGTSRTEYQVFSPIGGYNTILYEGQIVHSNFSETLQNRLSHSISGFFEMDSVAASGYLSLPDIKVLQDITLSANVAGTITGLKFGVGITSDGTTKTYGASWLEIDSTNVKHYGYNGTDTTLHGTYAHGLTMSSRMNFSVDVKNSGTSYTTTFSMFDNLGNIFTQSLTSWGQGIPFFINSSSSSLDVSLSFMPKRIGGKIWVFGDSYTSLTYSNRWPYYFAQNGESNWLLNAKPGATPSEAYSQLENLLTLHIPSMLVWTLGMNGGGDSGTSGSYVINSTQKTYIDKVVALCDSLGITLVLATIPTVPTQQKTAFNEYVRGLGVRYIDFAAAVGATSAGVWNTGLLSDDGVHPTIAGAKVLYSQVLVDCPELTKE